MEYKYLFGPIPSRRFGVSLGIDLSPDRKRCNFDCLYCELEPGRPVADYREVPGPVPVPGEILKEVEEGVERYRDLDVVTITANGEPTLYPHLGEVVEGVVQLEKRARERGGRWRSLILSNGSRIGVPAVREWLKKLSIVKLSLDTANPKTFKKLDRPVKGVELGEIVEGMEIFRREFSGELILEVLVVAGLNDTEEEFQALQRVFQQVKPDRVDLSTIDRPPAYRVKPVPVERLFQLAQLLEGVPVYIPLRVPAQQGEQRGHRGVELGEKELMETLKRRPWSRSDLTLLTPESRALFWRLVEEGKLEEIWVGGVQFFRPL
jgi:wyosine [tRNA(Phe)-imidazoG37] synthetase (radical SAM superfamily)